MKQTLKKLWQLAKFIWNHEIGFVSRGCGGGITFGKSVLAFAGLTSAVMLIVAWGFLIAVVFTPHC